jgi:hypothetical protein
MEHHFTFEESSQLDLFYFDCDFVFSDDQNCFFEIIIYLSIFIGFAYFEFIVVRPENHS